MSIPAEDGQILPSALVCSTESRQILAEWVDIAFQYENKTEEIALLLSGTFTSRYEMSLFDIYAFNIN